jgi:hypothetical protein
MCQALYVWFMIIIRSKKRTTFLVVLFFSLSAIAQETSGALDTKNGFRDAKFGMLISTFKGIVPTGMVTTFSNGSKTIEYKRPADVLRIGDIKLKSISYAFYSNKLSYITIEAGEEARVPLQKTFTQAYGKPRQFVRADNPDLFDFDKSVSKYTGQPYVKPKGYIWDGSKVKLTMLFSEKKDCSIIIRSKLIDREISNHDAEEERRMSKKRAADI